MRRPYLFFLSPIYALAVSIRNWLFDAGLLKSIRFGTPTLVIGNLSAGGSGKTPHTEYFLSLFIEKKCAVISRGYGRKTKGFLWVESDSTADFVGDEPLQMKKKYPHIPIAVCEDRVMAVPELMEQFPETELILFDDAFQHRYLNGKCQVLLSMYSDLFVDDTYLPGGNLRESQMAAKRADMVIVSKCPNNLNPSEMAILEEKLSRYTAAPVFFSRLEAENAVFPLGNERQSEELKEENMMVFSAIAGGSKWAESYRSLFKAKTGQLTYRDHHRFSIHDIRLLRKKWEALNKPLILTTEKDWMRLQQFQQELDGLPLLYFPIFVKFLKDDIALKKQLEFCLFQR
ncbi:MAG: tetraacyldisaccharide 4'-kinase [Bacteroidetes bacterium]|nr:tetraacyldisaccharide 4'-kinase [Bacteroidota bacterium]